MSRPFAASLLCLLWTMTLSPRCLGEPRDPNASVDQVVMLLDHMREWPHSPREDDARLRQAAIDGGREVERICAELDEFDLDTIRAGIERHHASKPLSDAPYIVTRYLFAISEEIPHGSREMGYVALGTAKYLAPEGVKLPLTNSFPWYTNEKGELRFCVDATGRFYMGPIYKPLPVFDFFREHFGRRKKAVEK